MRGAAVVLLAITGCGGDAPTGDDDPDVDAAAATVVEVIPCTGESATITTTGDSTYTPPATTITQGQIVKFELPNDHNVTPHPTMPSDPGLEVDFGGTKCLRFTQTGTFAFFCMDHSFRGTVTVN